MKKGIVITLCAVLFLCSTGCTSKEEKRQQEMLEKVQELTESMYSTTVDIKDSGKCKNQIASFNDVTIEMVSWDLGIADLIDGEKEILCAKFHITNNSDEQITLDDVISKSWFVDGVEVSYSFLVDFYGDGRTNKVYWDSDLRANSETDIYSCIYCSVSEPHKIELDISAEIDDEWVVVETFSFNTK